jgi:hypothetical protein
MNAQQILGTIWLMFCGYFGIEILLNLYRRNSTGALGDTPAWVVCVVLLFCLLYFIGVVASIFLIRGELWARRLIGLIATLSFLGYVGRFIALGSPSPKVYVFAIVSLVSAIILFYPKPDAA